MESEFKIPFDGSMSERKTCAMRPNSFILTLFCFVSACFFLGGECGGVLNPIKLHRSRFDFVELYVFL